MNGVNVFPMYLHCKYPYDWKVSRVGKPLTCMRIVQQLYNQVMFKSSLRGQGGQAPGEENSCNHSPGTVLGDGFG